MAVKRRQEIFEPMTMGHIRSHGFGDCDWHLWTLSSNRRGCCN